MIHPTRNDQGSPIDSHALAALHDQFYPVVYRYVRFRIEDIQASEDIAAEVFLRLLQAMRQPKKKIEDVRAWLMGTASNLVNDYYRLKYRRPVENLENYEHIVDNLTTEDQTDRNFDLEEVYRAIQRLTPDQQNVLALRFTQELPLDETAGLTGKTVTAVKVLQFRALTALRRLLTGREE